MRGTMNGNKRESMPGSSSGNRNMYSRHEQRLRERERRSVERATRGRWTLDAKGQLVSNVRAISQRA